MELLELGPLSPAQQAELVGDEVNPWGELGRDLEWRPKEHHVALLAPDGRLAAAAGWLIADVEVAGQVMPVVGIGGVIVAARFRGQGLGRCVISEAIGRAEQLDAQIAMLFCQPDRVELYERHGFLQLREPVRVQQRSGPVDMPMETMWRPQRPGASFPLGPVSLPGLPF